MTRDPAWFGLLGHLFLEAPDRRVLAALAHEEVRGTLEAHVPGVAGRIERAASDAALREELAVAWCSLFAAPGGPPPVASAWTTGHDGLAWAARVDDWSTALGLRWDDAAHGRPPPDHVGVLCHLAAAAIERANAPDADRSARRRADEVLRHGLRSWIPTWAPAAARCTDEPLYRAALDVLVGLLDPPNRPAGRRARRSKHRAR